MSDDEKLVLIFKIISYCLLILIVLGVVFLICKYQGPKSIFKCIFNILSFRWILKKIIKRREGKKHLRGQFERGIQLKIAEVIENDPELVEEELRKEDVGISSFHNHITLKDSCPYEK